MKTASLHEIPESAAAVIAALRDSTLRVARPSLILLFGSYARGEATPHSDVDILIVQAESDWKEPSRAEETARIRRAADTGLMPVDVLLFTPEEVATWRSARNHVIAHALADGLVLYERP